MAPIYPHVTTIAQAMESGAAREVSSLYGGYAARSGGGGGYPPWQVVERFLRLEFPSLDRRQIRRVRELSQEALAAGRAATRGAPGSRVFQGIAPGTARVVEAVAYVPLYRTDPRTGVRTQVYRYAVSVTVGRNDTVQDVKDAISQKIPTPADVSPDDPYQRGLYRVSNQEWGEPVFGYFQRF